MAEPPEKQISDKKQLAASGAEVIFLVFLVAFGMGLCFWVERAFGLIWKQPTEQQFLATPGIKEKQEKLTRLESRIKEAEKQLDTVTLDKLRHMAALNSLEKSHPEIRNQKQGNSTSVSDDVAKNYETAKMQQLATDEYAELLNARITSLKQEAGETAKALEPEKQAATKEFTWKSWMYRVAKFAASFLLPLPAVLGAWLVGTLVFNRVAKKRVWMSHGSLPILLVLGTLLILLAYQAFEIAGAVLIGMILFLVLLRKIDWSPPVGEKGTK